LFHGSELGILAMGPRHLSLFVMLNNFEPDAGVIAFDWTDIDSWQSQYPLIVPGFDDVSVEAPVAAMRRSDSDVCLFVPRTSSDIWTAKGTISIHPTDSTD